MTVAKTTRRRRKCTSNSCLNHWLGRFSIKWSQCGCRCSRCLCTIVRNSMIYGRYKLRHNGLSRLQANFMSKNVYRSFVPSTSVNFKMFSFQIPKRFCSKEQYVGLHFTKLNTHSYMVTGVFYNVCY